jgi:hypothetical protein
MEACNQCPHANDCMKVGSCLDDKRASHRVGTIPAAHDASSGQQVHGSTARGKDTSTDYERREIWARHRVVEKS